MKLIKPAWWVGKPLTCPICGCIFELEPNDRVDASMGAVGEIVKADTVVFKCGACEISLAFLIDESLEIFEGYGKPKASLRSGGEVTITQLDESKGVKNG